jgi:hypothetical protein
VGDEMERGHVDGGKRVVAPDDEAKCHGKMTGKPQGGRPEGRRKDELEDEGENTWQEVTGGNERKRGKGWARMALSGRRTVEGGGYWRWDNVGSPESRQFRTPPPPPPC